MVEDLVLAFKIAAIVALAAVFMLSINGLLSMLGSLIFTSVIGEVLGIVSACLPFDALAVFGVIGTAMTSILSFMLAKKIFDLSSWSLSTT